MPDIDWRAAVRARLASGQLDPGDEADVVEEVAQHLEQQFAELSARVGPAAAREQLLAELRDQGLDVALSTRRHAPKSRARWRRRSDISLSQACTALRQDLTYAWRSLRRSALLSASLVVTLTVGLGSAAAIFAVVDAVLLRPLPYGQPDRLVGVWLDMPPLSFTHIQQSLGTYLAFRRYARSIDGIAAYETSSINVTDPNGRADPERMHAALATASTFPLLQVNPILGRPYTDAEDVPKGPRVVVISEGVWRTRFAGDPNVIGKTLVIDGNATQIIGVMPTRFRFPDASTQLWLPLAPDPTDIMSSGFNLNTVARMKPGITIAAVSRDFTNLLPRAADIAPMFAPGITTRTILDQARPRLDVVPLRDDVVGAASRTLWIVAAAAVLVLLVTCANVANLLLVRADGRHRELSVRAALGAGRQRVLSYFFAEAALLSVISAVVALGVAAVAVRLLVGAGPAQLPRLAEVRIDWVVVAFALAVALLVAGVCTAIPAVRFSRGDLLAGLREGGRGGTVGGRRQRARSALVAAQVALALVVLAASGLLLRSFERLRAVRPGFDANGVATLWLSLPSQRYHGDSSVVRFYAQLVRRAAALPGVRAVGITSRLPLQSDRVSISPVYVEGAATPSSKMPPLELYASVDSGYFSAMRIPIIAGHNFDRLDRQRGNEALISQEAARVLFHDSTGRAALDQRFRMLPNDSLRTIVGVVGSMRDTSLFQGPARAVYVPESLGGDTAIDMVSTTMAVVARTSGDVAATTRALQRLVRDLDPSLPTFDVSSMQATVDASIASVTFTMIVFGAAAGVTLLLAVVGLYGVIAYIVTLRTRELGVRIALGAQPRAVAAMVTRQALALCGVGIAAGLVVVVALARFLGAFLYQVAPTDPVTLAAASILLLTVALLAAFVPARRAAAVSPIEALRAD